MTALITFIPFLLMLLVTLSDQSGITTRLSTRMVTGSSTIELTCKVAPNAANRQLRYGFVEWTSSEAPINGTEDRPTHGPFRYTNVPCGVPAAYCVVVRNDGSQKQDIVNLEQVGDCQGGQHEITR